MNMTEELGAKTVDEAIIKVRAYGSHPLSDFSLEQKQTLFDMKGIRRHPEYNDYNSFSIETCNGICHPIEKLPNGATLKHVDSSYFTINGLLHEQKKNQKKVASVVNPDIRCDSLSNDGKCKKTNVTCWVKQNLKQAMRETIEWSRVHKRDSSGRAMKQIINWVELPKKENSENFTLNFE